MFAVEVDGANDENSFCKDGYVFKILTVKEIKSAEEQEKREDRADTGPGSSFTAVLHCCPPSISVR